jgi:hypothetical protein
MERSKYNPLGISTRHTRGDKWSHGVKNPMEAVQLVSSRFHWDRIGECPWHPKAGYFSWMEVLKTRAHSKQPKGIKLGAKQTLCKKHPWGAVNKPRKTIQSLYYRIYANLKK